MQGGSFLFPITPVFNSSLQCSHNQSISLISKPQDQCTIILSPSTPQPAVYDRAPHTHIHTPSKHLNSNESPTKIVDNIQPHNFSDQSQISTMVSDHTDHRPRAGLTCRYLIYARTYQHKTLTFTSRGYLLHTRVRGSTHRERNDPYKYSNSKLNKNEQRSIACGGEFKVKMPT